MLILIRKLSYGHLHLPIFYILLFYSLFREQSASGSLRGPVNKRLWGRNERDIIFITKSLAGYVGFNVRNYSDL